MARPTKVQTMIFLTIKPTMRPIKVHNPKTKECCLFIDVSLKATFLFSLILHDSTEID